MISIALPPHVFPSLYVKCGREDNFILTKHWLSYTITLLNMNFAIDPWGGEHRENRLYTMVAWIEDDRDGRDEKYIKKVFFEYRGEGFFI